MKNTTEIPSTWLRFCWVSTIKWTVPYHSQTFNSDQLHFIAGKRYLSRSSEHRNRMYVFIWMSFASVICNNTFCTGFYKIQITTLREPCMPYLAHPQRAGEPEKITLSQPEGRKKHNPKRSLYLCPSSLGLFKRH